MRSKEDEKGRKMGRRRQKIMKKKEDGTEGGR
jgi:hypothetical protein